MQEDLFVDSFHRSTVAKAGDSAGAFSLQEVNGEELTASGIREARRHAKNRHPLEPALLTQMRSFRISPDARYRSAASTSIIDLLDFTTVAKIGFAGLQRLDCETTAARRLKLGPAGAVVGCKGRLE